MDAPTLLTTRRNSNTNSLVIVDGETEIAAVFGSPGVQERRAAELISHANTFRELRAARAAIKITKGKIKQ